MPVTYISDDGFRTRDYTMDASDVARMRAGTDISGQAKDPSLYPLDSYINNPASPTVWNQSQPGYAGAPSTLPGRPMVRPNVTSQPAAIPDSSFSGIDFSKYNPTELATMRAGNPTAYDAALANHVQALGTAQTPLDYSSPAALAASQRKRASYVPGAINLLDSLTKGSAPGTPLVINQDGTIGSDLSGGKKSAGTLDTRISDHPMFRTMMTLNPENAKRAYANLSGRDYDADLKTTQAMLDTQNTNDMELGKVARQAIVAQTDNPKLGIKKGDVVKQVIQTGVVPGTVDVGEAPFTDLESKAMGIVGRNTDGTQSFVKGSIAHKTFGMSTIGDDRATVATDKARQAALDAKSRAGTTGVNDPLVGFSKDARMRMTTAGTVQRTADEQSAVDTDAGMAGVFSDSGQSLASTGRGVQNFLSARKGNLNGIIQYFGGPKDTFGAPSYVKSNADWMDQFADNSPPMTDEERQRAARLQALDLRGPKF